MITPPTWSDGRNGNRAYVAPTLGKKPRLPQVDEANCIFCPQNWGNLQLYEGVDAAEMSQRGMLVYYNPYPQVDLHLTVVGTKNHNLDELAPTQEALDYWINFFWANAKVSDALEAAGHNFVGIGKNRNGRTPEGVLKGAEAGGSQPHDHFHIGGTYEIPVGLEDRLYPDSYFERNLVKVDGYSRLDGCIRCKDTNDYVSGRKQRLFSGRQLDRFVVYVEEHPENTPYNPEIKIVPLEHLPHLSKLSHRDLIYLARIHHETMVILNKEYPGMGYNILVREGPRKTQKGDPRTYHFEVRIFPTHPQLRNGREVGIMSEVWKAAILQEDPKTTTAKLERHISKDRVPI